MSRKYVRPLMNEKTCPVAQQLTRQFDSLANVFAVTDVCCYFVDTSTFLSHKKSLTRPYCDISGPDSPIPKAPRCQCSLCRGLKAVSDSGQCTSGRSEGRSPICT